MSPDNLAVSTPHEKARVARLAAMFLMVGLMIGLYLSAMKLRHAQAGASTSTYGMSGSTREGSKVSPIKRSIQTPSGRISYIEQGKGPVALFVHGVLLNGHLWRHQLSD